MRNIYISSLAFLGKSPEEMIATAVEHKWALEFSSGIAFRKDMEEVYLKAPLTRMPHNYFPAPEIPFVLNLASINDSIRKQSIAHCKRGLWLAKQTGSPFFSAHAGFCIDPNPNELGRKIKYNLDFGRDKNRQRFVEALNVILDEADDLGVDFLIENNVIASFNVVEGKINPLLCCESKEITWVFDTVRRARLGLLLDTAHLKVSCKTLILSLQNELQAIAQYIRGIHHSDNDGLVDDNQPIQAGYWFLNYMKLFSKTVHVIEVKNIDNRIIQQQQNLLLSSGY